MMIVAQHIRRAALLYPKHLAAICEGERRTHAELDERSSRLANVLLGLGLRRGARVAVLLENSIRCIEVDFALSKAGLVRVALNPRITASELAFILTDAEPAAIIHGMHFNALIAAVRDACRSIRHSICVKESAAAAESGKTIDYEEALVNADAEAPAVELGEEDIHSIAYTSGSSGNPKGVILTQRAIVQVAYNVLLELGPEAPGEKVLLLQPLSHGSAYFVLAYYMRGCAVVLMRQFNAQCALELVRDLEIETVKLVPTMLQRILALPEIEKTSFPRLRQIVYGGSHIPMEVLRRSVEMLGPRLAQHYGQTEAPSMLSVMSRHEHTLENVASGLLKSAGRPVTTVAMRVVDEAGRALPTGEIGELIVRAPHAMSGYWKRDDLTSTVLREGWLHTNDLARFDECGYVFLIGRKDEMIISGGYNIAPREVEDVLCKHPAITEAAVFGRADPEWGQAVIAVVALCDTSATKAQLVEYSRKMLGYKRPKDILIVDELPKNPNGKIDKSVLKRAFGGA